MSQIKNESDRKQDQQLNQQLNQQPNKASNKSSNESSSSQGSPGSKVVSTEQPVQRAQERKPNGTHTGPGETSVTNDESLGEAAR